MKETTLLKIALISSLVGMIALYFVSTQIDVKDYKPTQLNENVGDDVKLIGTVTDIADRGSVIFIEVNQQNPVTVVLFTDDDIRLKSGDSVEVFGEVQEYKGKNEILAQKIRVLR